MRGIRNLEGGGEGEAKHVGGMAGWMDGRTGKGGSSKRSDPTNKDRSKTPPGNGSDVEEEKEQKVKPDRTRPDQTGRTVRFVYQICSAA